ncbi:hypothetical protein ACFSCW_04630 [Sphingomonas tabacisoli]|uniref:Lipoprotein n=1 Tax=Sphingomonas tabacisoli TaxID=2249466 RepID=A0ABW4I056_9SPHN
MRRHLIAFLVPLALAACSGGGKDKIADKVEDNANNRAEAMDEAADTMTNALQANAVEQQANIVRSAGHDRAEAIRESDLPADKLTENQKNAIVAGKGVGTPAPSRR